MHPNLTGHDALFLDLDGTLIEIAQTPDGVIVPDGLAGELGRLVQVLQGALAIITGRPIGDVDRLLAPLVPVAAGIHGAELRALQHGEVVSRAGPIDDEIVQAFHRLAANYPGILVEPKGVSVALHYRQAPALAEDLQREIERVLRDGPGHLMVVEGRFVFEILPRNASKGSALETIMELPAFVGRRPIIIGDDLPDEPAIEAAIRLGGMGLKVAGEHFSSEEADFTGPADVRNWLKALL